MTALVKAPIAAPSRTASLNQAITATAKKNKWSAKKFTRNEVVRERSKQNQHLGEDLTE
jgi:hypothetical protein